MAAAGGAGAGAGAVTVFGIFVVDMVWRPAKLPAAGETVLAPTMTTSMGGKGANQAFAAARAGARTRMVGAVGDDAFGAQATQAQARVGVDVAAVKTVPGLPTGAAAVLVQADTGENQICVGIGANAELKAEQLTDAMLADTALLVLQMECPLEQNWEVVRRAKAARVPILLNVAPAGAVPADALAAIDVLVVNEPEAAAVATLLHAEISAWCAERGLAAVAPAAWEAAGGVKAARPSLMALSALFDLSVVITLGAAGAEAFTQDPEAAWVRVPALAVNTVDTVGAGDAFVGFLAAGLAAAPGGGARGLAEAMRRAAVAGSLSTTVHGAQDGVPAPPAVDAEVARVPAQVTKAADLEFAVGVINTLHQPPLLG